MAEDSYFDLFQKKLEQRRPFRDHPVLTAHGAYICSESMACPTYEETVSRFNTELAAIAASPEKTAFAALSHNDRQSACYNLHGVFEKEIFDILLQNPLMNHEELANAKTIMLGLKIPKVA